MLGQILLFWIPLKIAVILPNLHTQIFRISDPLASNFRIWIFFGFGFPTPQSQIPSTPMTILIGRFVLTEIVLIVLSMAIAVVTMFFHERATTRRWKISTWLGWLTTKKSNAIENHQISNREIESIIFQKPQITNPTLPHSMPFDLNTESSSNEIVLLLQKSLKQLKGGH
jgi:hypothetical protein